MAEKPKSIQNILSEAMLIRDFLGLEQPKLGRSRIISSWTRQGLRYVEVSERRYFFEEDLVDFFWGKYKEMGKQKPLPV
jgi:hypothetical protein